MKKFIFSFMRYEKKYLINEKVAEDFLNAVGDRFSSDEYGESRICNLYYDTEHYNLIRHSLSKPKYKEKLRLRCYGKPENNSSAFVEIKKKFDGVVYKRRICLEYKNAENYLNGTFSPEKSQIKSEIDFLLMRYGKLSPKMAIYYLRNAYICKENPDLRITFDKDILWRKTDLDLTLPVSGNEILPPGYVLMEIKIPGAVPVWLARILSEKGIFPVNFSKYGNAYLNMCGKNSENKAIIGGN